MLMIFLTRTMMKVVVVVLLCNFLHPCLVNVLPLLLSCCVSLFPNEEKDNAAQEQLIETAPDDKNDNHILVIRQLMMMVVGRRRGIMSKLHLSSWCNAQDAERVIIIIIMIIIIMVMRKYNV